MVNGNFLFTFLIVWVFYGAWQLIIPHVISSFLLTILLLHHPTVNEWAENGKNIVINTSQKIFEKNSGESWATFIQKYKRPL